MAKEKSDSEKQDEKPSKGGLGYLIFGAVVVVVVGLVHLFKERREEAPPQAPARPTTRAPTPRQPQSRAQEQRQVERQITPEVQDPVESQIDFPQPAQVPVQAQEQARCGICWEYSPRETLFSGSACTHTYCRECARRYIRNAIVDHDLLPRCPEYDSCHSSLSDVDVRQVLTREEQEEYDNASIAIASTNEPGIWRCHQDGCTGAVSLADDNPRFECPQCHARRCVRCDAREWHNGRTCELARARGVGSTLPVEQLRAIYGNREVYQCGSCAFGPIEMQNCSNLSTHHNEAVRGGGRYNNACPRCGWFAANISAWPRWDGREHQPTPAPAAARARHSNAVPPTLRGIADRNDGTVLYAHPQGWATFTDPRRSPRSPSNPRRSMRDQY